MALRRHLLLPALSALLVLSAVPGNGAATGIGGAGGRALAAVRSGPPAAPPLIAVLCYHDVADGPGPSSTISPAALREQIRGLKATGWTILPLSALLARGDRPAELPPRVAVLTFDDGYKSFLERVIPILREEGVTATLAISDSLTDAPPPDIAPLMTWEEIRLVARSGLVEIASHSHDLHKYVTSNPYRDTGASVTTRRYLLAEERYENRDEYRRRIGDDLRESRRRLRAELGRDVSALAWPYGENNAAAREIAAREGFATTLGLDGTHARGEDVRRRYLPRVMVFRGMRIGGGDLSWLYPRPRPVRAAQVDLDAVYDPDPARFRERVDRMVAKVRSIGATHAILQACPDPRGDGSFREAWFMNHQAPVKADIWSMVAAKLSHAGIEVWIRAPSMNIPWAWERHPEWRIPYEAKDDNEPAPWYFRLSPDLEGSRRAAVDFLTDAAVYLPIQGVLFDDDAYMLAGERLRGDGAASPAAKSASMRDLIEELKAAVLAWRPQCRFGRNIYAPPVEGEGAHPRFAQDLDQFLRDYDMTFVMAYARMEGRRKDAGAWVASLVRRATSRWTPAGGQESWSPPVLIKLQAYDWGKEAWIPGEELRTMARGAREAMAVNLGVYPVIAGEDQIPEGFLGGAGRR